MEEKSNNNNNSRSILGIILMLVGFAIIAKAFHILPNRVMHHIFTWEMILIVLGVILLISKENKGTGIILLVIGLVFWIPDVVYLPYPSRKIFWGGVFIAIGILMLLRTTTSFGLFESRKIANDTNYIDDVSIFGGGDRIITSQTFKGGKVTAIFGGSKIDFTKANLATGKNIIDVFCLFGGSTFIVPPGWNVKVDVVSILGGFSDKRSKAIETEPIDAGKELIIKGFVMFGGGEIKN